MNKPTRKEQLEDALWHLSTVNEQLTETRDMLARVTGQLAALQQSNASLVEKWRVLYDEALKRHTDTKEETGHLSSFDAAQVFAYGNCADALETATKKVTT